MIRQGGRPNRAGQWCPLTTIRIIRALKTAKRVTWKGTLARRLIVWLVGSGALERSATGTGRSEAGTGLFMSVIAITPG